MPQTRPWRRRKRWPELNLRCPRTLPPASGFGKVANTSQPNAHRVINTRWRICDSLADEKHQMQKWRTPACHYAHLVKFTRCIIPGEHTGEQAVPSGLSEPRHLPQVRKIQMNPAAGTCRWHTVRWSSWSGRATQTVWEHGIRTADQGTIGLKSWSSWSGLLVRTTPLTGCIWC
jgi:hypothetical protein